MSKNNERKGRAFPVIAGAAAAVAVIGTGALGIDMLNKYGGLKEGGAGYSANEIIAPAADAEYIDISELAGRTFEFSDLTVKIHSAQYDGRYLRLDYEGISDNPHMRGNFILESTTHGYFSSKESDFGRFWRDGEGEFDRGSDNMTLVLEIPADGAETLRFIPTYRKSDEITERKTDTVVTARCGNTEPVFWSLGGEESELFRQIRMDIYPLAMKVDLRSEPDLTYAEAYDKFPSVTAVFPDGSQWELEANSQDSEVISDNKWWYTMYVPVSPDTPSLLTASSLIVNDDVIVLKEPADAETESRDISEAVGEVLEFDDFTAEILNVEYDGHFLRVIYKADRQNEADNASKDGGLNIYEYQTAFKRHWFGGCAPMPELGDNVFMLSRELELEPGETTERLAFVPYPSEPYEESRIQHIGEYTVTGLAEDKFFAAQPDIDGVKGIVISPLGAYILSDRDYAEQGYNVTLDRLILNYNDGTQTELPFETWSVLIEFYDDHPDNDTIAKFGYIMNSLGLSDTSPEGLAVSTIILSEYDPIDVENLASVTLKSKTGTPDSGE